MLLLPKYLGLYPYISVAKTASLWTISTLNLRSLTSDSIEFKNSLISE